MFTNYDTAKWQSFSAAVTACKTWNQFHGAVKVMFSISKKKSDGSFNARVVIVWILNVFQCNLYGYLSSQKMKSKQMRQKCNSFISPFDNWKAFVIDVVSV